MVAGFGFRFRACRHIGVLGIRMPKGCGSMQGARA